MIMKNVLTLLAYFMRQGLVQFATLIFMLLALMQNANAATHVFGNQAVTVQAFTKSAKRICDTITYNFHVYILTNGGPTNVIISDIWPNGLKPASAVTFSGVTSSPAATNVNASGWSVQFDTPLGAGFVASSYTLSFTSTIDPAALTGGDFKMANQAKIAIGPKNSPDYERSDDPSQPGKEDKTVLDIPVAEIKKCLGDQAGSGGTGGPTPFGNSCFSPDVKVVCGKVAGTYDIVLNAQSLNGVTPSSVSITPTNASVTIVNPQASYPVVAGQVKITVAGATPGAVLNFDVNGFTAGGGSFDVADLCFSGTV